MRAEIQFRPAVFFQVCCKPIAFFLKYCLQGTVGSGGNQITAVFRERDGSSVQLHFHECIAVMGSGVNFHGFAFYRIIYLSIIITTTVVHTNHSAVLRSDFGGDLPGIRNNDSGIYVVSEFHIEMQHVGSRLLLTHEITVHLNETGIRGIVILGYSVFIILVQGDRSPRAPLLLPGDSGNLRCGFSIAVHVKVDAGRKIAIEGSGIPRQGRQNLILINCPDADIFFRHGECGRRSSWICQSDRSLFHHPFDEFLSVRCCIGGQSNGRALDGGFDLRTAAVRCLSSRDGNFPGGNGSECSCNPIRRTI